MAHKTMEMEDLSIDQLRARRKRLAAKLPDVQLTLRGALQTQSRRCGKPACRCAGGELHGPYVYLATRSGDRTRMLYVGSDMADEVSRHVEVTAGIEAVLAEISAINVELLKRGELS